LGGGLPVLGGGELVELLLFPITPFLNLGVEGITLLSYLPRLLKSFKLSARFVHLLALCLANGFEDNCFMTGAQRR
jgi:hypothetical protein